MTPDKSRAEADRLDTDAARWDADADRIDAGSGDGFSDPARLRRLAKADRNRAKALRRHADRIDSGKRGPTFTYQPNPRNCGFTSCPVCHGWQDDSTEADHE